MKNITFLSLLSSTIVCISLFSCGRSITNNKDDSLNPNENLSPNEDENSKPNNDNNSKPEIPENNENILSEIHNIRILSKDYSYCYTWSNNGFKYFGNWPGSKMKKLDETWNYIDLPSDVKEINVVLNNGSSSSQTQDFKLIGAGYHWFDKTSNSWSKTNKYGGEINNQIPDKNPDIDDNQIPNIDENEENKFDPVIVNSYKDFKLWEEMKANPEKYKVVNKYKGSRHDFRDETIYFAMTTRFYDGDLSNNVYCWDSKHIEDDPEWRGDFKGLIERLDYIKALGFTSIWITPVVSNASGFDYHGYHAHDMSKVDKRYESTDCSFQDLINAIHEKDMKIILDVVLNHTGNFGERNLMPLFDKKDKNLDSVSCMEVLPESNIASNYYQMNSGEQYDERISKMKNTRNDGSDSKDIYHHYGNFSWESFGEQVAQIAGDCVDLNTENPEVAEYLVKCYGNFIRMGVDYFRIDTMKHISRLTFNNYLLPAFYEYAKLCGNDEFFVFGEVCTRVREVWNRNIPALSAPFYTWKEDKKYPWGDKDTNLNSIELAYNDNKQVHNEPTSHNAFLNGLDYHKVDKTLASGTGVIDFPMHWNFYEAKNAFNIAINNDKYYNDATYNVVYVDSHDYAPDECQQVRYNKGTNAWAENLSLMFTFRGVPCIYYGSEIEFQKNKPIDKGPNLALKDSGRAYFGDYLKGNIQASNFGEYKASGNVNQTLNYSLAKHIQDLNLLRANVPALKEGQYTTKNVSSNSMAFTRRYQNESIDSLALVTISGSATFSNLPNGIYVDLVTGTRKEVTTNSLSASCSGQGNLRCFVLENSSTGHLDKIVSRSPFLK